MTISELITKMAVSPSSQIANEIEAMFPNAVLGLLMQGLPRGEHGSEYMIGTKDNVTMAYVIDPNGKRMIKACADPSVFDKNYPGCINVTMTGHGIMEMALKLDDMAGILVCSATSFHSYPIYKDRFGQLPKQG